MATISTSIALHDNFSGVLNHVITSVNMSIGAIERMNSAISQPIDTSVFKDARNEIALATVELHEMAEAMNRVDVPMNQGISGQKKFNQEIQEGAEHAENLGSMIKNAVGAYVGMKGVRMATDFIQDCTEAYNTQLNAETQLISVLANMLDEDYVAQFELETTADITGAVEDINSIQNNIDDVTVNVSAGSRALNAAFDEIKNKASEIQGRGIYGDETMIAAAAEFSTYFTDTNAITMMMDTLADYAMGMSGGGELDSTAMVDYATNLGKIMSGAYDAMTKKGFQFSDAQKAIIEGEATREQIVAALGEEYVDMSEDMQAAAAITQIIDESWAGLYESMSNTPEGKIIQMTNAWGDMKETVGGQLYPYVLLLVDAITNNWSTIEGIISGITVGLQFMIGIVSWLVEGALGFAQVIIDNWGWISPIIFGIVSALAIYYGWLLLTKGAEAIVAAGKIVLCVASYAHAAATGAETSATAAATAAQYGLNTALLACPLTWIVVAIIAVIAIIYAVIAAINKVQGTTVSATGVIFGLIAMLGAFIWNTAVGLTNAIIQYIWANFVEPFIGIIEFILNAANGGFDSFGDAVANLVGNIISWFLSLGEVVTKIIDAIFGTNWTAGLESLKSRVIEWGKNENAITLSREAPTVLQENRIEYEDAFLAGYGFGGYIEDSIENTFDVPKIPSPEDYVIPNVGSGFDADQIGDNIASTADNTADMAESLSMNDEDLKLLREMAERQAINRFTTAEVKVEFGGVTNHINSDMDIDGFVDVVTERFEEALLTTAEGVHV